MTDAHCHAPRPGVRSFVCAPCADGSAVPPSGHGDVRFAGWHPWRLDGFDPAALDAALEADPRLGVGEIGMDRLRSKTISPEMRRAFSVQLEIAASRSRPVVLHGAKCWGEVVRACREYAGRIPAFLFHGFSRSAGLVPEIAAMGGFVSVGPALLNLHAVNLREFAQTVPLSILLAESDAEPGADATPVEDVVRGLAALRSMDFAALEAVLDANADRFAASLSRGAAAECGGAS